MFHLQLNWFRDNYEVHEAEAVDFMAISEEVSIVDCVNYLFDCYFVFEYYLLRSVRLWEF